ncbi:origin recognition complex subunit 4 C-terminus-domain-containing protein [Aspergillus pseudodeflectus]|uniref:Origin recognition complex subunit 4 n=1 Tax=Aspergillus pseudodeflectus TaxID=176178 RepID=A0ABR4L063_9EURO
MKDPRSAKRRRVSDAAAVDEDGDIEMHDDGTTPQKEVDDNNRATTPTPSRTGLRSSGRQRKAPQRYEDEPVQTQSARKRRAGNTSTPARATPRSTRGKSHVSETGSEKGVEEGEEYKDDEEEEEEPSEAEPEPDSDSDPEVGPGSPKPRARRAAATRARPKRASVRFTDTDGGASKAVNGDGEGQSPAAADDFQDGLDDLVSMQLQQDLVQDYTNGGAHRIEEGEAIVAEEPLPPYAEQFQQLVQGGYAKEVRLLTKTVISKLNGKRLVPLKGLENEYHKVHQLIEQTVTVGEGNSLLLLGSRGSGKTAIIETIVSSLAKEHKNDFHVVRLNGFLHTDDRLALREIWRQLGRETDTAEEAGKVTSYADTMATLLALLSHPEELRSSADDQDGTTTRTAKSIVIVLDEFDLFVTHPRQTLLYNLFDIAQARKAPLAVLGVTTKVDVTEALEKRVKSRFSHRSVYVPLPRTFEVFSDACLAGLDLADDETLEFLEGFDSDELSIAKSEAWRTALERWRVYLQGLWADPAFQTHLRRIYHQTKSIKEFFTSALIGITDLHHSTIASTTSPFPTTAVAVPTPATFSDNLLSCPDPTPLPFSASISNSSSPSSLPLSLLLAATRLAALYDPSLESAAQTQQQADLAPLALSFPAAYAEYVRLLTSAKTSASVSGASVTPGRVWGRDVAREAWERLVSWGLISPVGGGSGTADGRMFRVEISLEEVVGMAGSGGSLGRWWRDA